MKYKSEAEVLGVINAFEDASIARDVWTHAEHLVVALYYLDSNHFDAAYTKMKDGIFNLLINGFKVDLGKEMPYHETITMFWMRTVDQFNRSRNGSSLLDKTNEIVTLFDKDYPLMYYSRERLFSAEARAGFVEGDVIGAVPEKADS